MKNGPSSVAKPSGRSALNLLLDLARLLEARQEYTQATETLVRLLAADRSHEQAHAGLMRLYALSGQRQQALRQYQALKEMLQAEARYRTEREYNPTV